jgi:small subunit ribosomal protein S8
MVTNLTTKAVAKKFSGNISDPVADLLTRIRNSNLAYKDELFAPASKQNESVLKILVAEGFLIGYGREGEGVHQSFRIALKYGAKRQRAITGLKRISKPGRRIYRGRDELPRVLGVAIISTSQGVMTDREASRKRIGGEILAYVW